METRTDIISLDNQTSNVYKVTLSGREYTAVGVSDDHVIVNVSTPDRNYDTPEPPTITQPSYNIVPSQNNVDEGTSLPISIVTSNVSNGTVLYWSITNGNDFVASSGQVTISNNSGQFNVTPIADFTTEGPESFIINLRVGSANGTIVAQSNTLTINDTSTTPTPSVPTYAISTYYDNIDEGLPLNVTVTTENVPDGTVLYWNLTNLGDFIDNTGQVTITGNSAEFSVTPIADNITEGPETFKILLRLSSVSGTIVAATDSITINDTSIETPSPGPGLPTPTPPTTPSGASTIPISSTNISDTNCSRIIFKEDFDPQKDIYISYEIPSPSILTEGEENILTEDGFTLLVENEFFNSTGFVTYITKSELDEENGQPGIGLGLLATTGTAFQNVSGHLVSVAVDLEGGYALSGVFKDSGNRGSLVKLPNSITARVSNNSSEYDFLSSSTYNNLSGNSVDIEAIRVGFKDLLSVYTLDVKINGTYSRILEAQYNFSLDDIPERVKIGISHSGREKLVLRDITYSGVISS